MANYLFVHFKEHTNTFEKYYHYLERYIEGEHYLEITEDLLGEKARVINKNDKTMMDTCDVSKYSSNTNPSSFFKASSEEGSSCSETEQSTSSSNTSEILSVINKTLKECKGNRTKRDLISILKSFYIYTDEFLEENKLDTRICYILGRCKELGLFGHEIDLAAAYKYYNLSAGTHYPLGVYYLARCYEFGIGTNKEKETARDLYRSVAKLGHDKGLYRYALICLKNDEVPLGLNYMRQAMKAKEREVLSVIKSTKDDPDNVFGCKGKGFLVSNCPYFYHLGTLYMIKHSQLLRDVPYAYSIFKKGAELGCKHSLFMVAEFHEKGTHVEKDMVLAYKYYAEAAALGQSDAQVKIGRLLISKSKTEKKPEDVKLGITYLEKSAFSGNTKGMIALADAFYLGSTGKRDVPQAFWWYKIAESMGENVTEQIKKTENFMSHNKYNGF